MKKVCQIAILCLSISLLNAQNKKGSVGVKNPNPVNDAVISSEKDLNDYIVKKFGYPERVEFYELNDALKHPDVVTSLKLHHLDLTEVPKEINQFKNLVELDLSNNKITSVAGKLSGLNNLQLLNLSGNELTEIPADLGSLKNLRVLNLSSNKIAAGSIFNDKLERLYLNNNQLTSLPSGILSNKNLKTLYLHFNALTTLDEGLLKLTNLEALLVQFNKIAVEPDLFSQNHGIIAYSFHPQAVNSRYIYKGLYGRTASLGGGISYGAAPSNEEDAEPVGNSFAFGDKVEDYQYNIKTSDAGNGFRKVKVDNYDYRKYSKLRLMIGKPIGVLLVGVICPIHWMVAKNHRNNWRMSKIYYKQLEVDQLIAKGPTRKRIKAVNEKNEQIVNIYRRYLKDNKIKAN